MVFFGRRQSLQIFLFTTALCKSSDLVEIMGEIEDTFVDGLCRQNHFHDLSKPSLFGGHPCFHVEIF